MSKVYLVTYQLTLLFFHCLQDDTNRPNIHLETMTIRRIKQHFRGDIVRRPAYCPTASLVSSVPDRLPGCLPSNVLLPIPWLLYQGRQTEISNLDIHTGIKKKIPQLEVPMNDIGLVHVLASRDELDEYVSCFGLGIASSPAKQIHQALRKSELSTSLLGQHTETIHSLRSRTALVSCIRSPHPQNNHQIVRCAGVRASGAA